MNENRKFNWRKGAGIAAAAMLSATLMAGGPVAAQAAEGGVAAQAWTVQALSASTQANNYIGAEAAKEAALKDSGLQAKDVTFSRVKCERSDGVMVYKVKFTSGNWKYVYKIKAVDGTVAKISKAPVKTEGAGTTSSKAFIGVKAAKKAALKDAGITSTKEVTFTKQKRDTEDDITVYDIEFVYNGIEYEYEINAVTGAIYSMEQSQAEDGSGSVAGTGQTSKYIGLAAAKEVAATDAGVAVKDAVFTKAKREKDDGQYIYDIEFTAGNKKYEYEIRATDGMVLDKESETIEETQSSSKYIGVAAAKQAALSHSGVSSANAVFKKAKLERDDGVWQYKIEFYSGSMEYEYEIDAKTGTILEYDWEEDD